jgi:hypothetical protein
MPESFFPYGIKKIIFCLMLSLADFSSSHRKLVPDSRKKNNVCLSSRLQRGYNSVGRAEFQHWE